MATLRIKQFDTADIDAVFAIQQAAFGPLYSKYRDEDTSPFLESRETVLSKYTREGTCGYLFFADETPVGAVRVVLQGNNEAKISALCVLPEYQRRGIAFTAMKEIEKLHGDIGTWHLSTILEEEGNCRLYEKLGYQRIGELLKVNERLTLVFYDKKRENK